MIARYQNLLALLGCGRQQMKEKLQQMSRGKIHLPQIIPGMLLLHAIHSQGSLFLSDTKKSRVRP